MATGYQLETIPVWDGIRSGSECFICDLMQKAEEDSLGFYLGSSVMNPETRILVNSIGFCPEHTAKLVESGHPNSMAVLWESHLKETMDKLGKALEDIGDGRRLKKSVSDMDRIIKGREDGCLICNRMKDRLDRYAFTIPYLWARDKEFRVAFGDGKGFCLHHSAHILKMSLKTLDAKSRKDFSRAMAELLKRNLERIAHDLRYMAEHYKSENRDKPWNGCEDAQRRAVYKEIGKGRCE